MHPGHCPHRLCLLRPLIIDMHIHVCNTCPVFGDIMCTFCGSVYSLCTTGWLLRMLRLCFYPVHELLSCLWYFFCNLEKLLQLYMYSTCEDLISLTFLCLRALLPTRFLKRQSFFFWWALECNAKDEYFSDLWCSFLYFCEIFFAECVIRGGLKSIPSSCGNIALNLVSTSLTMRSRQRSFVASVQLYERDSTTFSVVRTCWRAFWVETECYKDKHTCNS